MRKPILAAVLASATLLWAGLARSGDGDKARSIIDAGIKATGGEANLKKFRAMTWNEKGTYYGMGEGQPYTGKYAVQWPDDFRMEIKEVFVIVFNSDKGWMKFGGETKEMSKEELAQQHSNHKAGWIATLLPLKDKAFALKMLDEAQIDKKPAAGVQVTRQGYPEVKLYFDKKSGLLVKNEFRTFSPEEKKMVNQEVFHQDYKDFDGVKAPTHVIIKRDGKLFVDAHGSDYKFHDKLDAKVFAMP
jgi:hypothetical protein